MSVGVRNPLTQAYAAVSGTLKQRKYQGVLLKGLKPAVAFKVISGSKDVPPKKLPSDPVFKAAGRTRVAFLGYPYALYDPFISAGVYDKLKKLGVEVVTFEQIPLREMRRYSKVMPQNFFWYYSNQVCWTGLYFLDKKNIDGIIHVTTFGCGPDAMVDKTLELEAKSAGVPFLGLAIDGLAIDGHPGEGGVQTHLEAFVDMLWAKRQKYRTG